MSVVHTSGPEGVLAAMPYLVGCHPTNSVVICLASDDGLILISARADLEYLGTPDLIPIVLRAALRTRATTALVAVYSESLTPQLMGQSKDFALDLELASSLSATPLSVRQLLAVGTSDDRWVDVHHDWTAGQGSPYSALATHPAALEMVLTGNAPLEDRAALEALIAPGSESIPEGFALAFARMMQAMRDLEDAEVARCVATELELCDLDGSTMGRLTALLSHPAGLWSALSHLNENDAAVYLPAWLQLVRVTQGNWAVGPLVVSGVAAWVAGEGSYVNLAHDHLMTIDPDHWLIPTLAAVTNECLPPSSWPTIRDKLASQQEVATS